MLDHSYDVPVLLVVFNRLNEVKKSLKAISAAQPKHFFVFSDGARPGNIEDLSRIADVREFIKNAVTWECQFDFFCSEVNVGCDNAVCNGLERLFKDRSYLMVLK